MSVPLVAIVGRPNVGKSTIFNRATRTHKAITSPEPGVTRDRHLGDVDWQGRQFQIMDTGGWIPRSEEVFDAAIREQVEFALNECDLVLFVCDLQTGPTDVDIEIARMLQRGDRPVIPVVNKSDNEVQELETATFFQLGLGEPMPMSATSGRGFAEVLDSVVARLPEVSSRQALSRPRPLIAVVGRPNVGKSSFVNSVIGHTRHLVTEIAGTTRDAIDSVVNYYQTPLTLIDTAGLRRRTRVKEAVEFYTGVRTRRAIDECDVAVVLTDATEGVVSQDVKILQEAADLGKGMALCINKWDLVEKDTRTAAQYERDLDRRFASFTYVPKYFISAIEKQRVFKILEAVLKIYEERQKRIDTPRLNRFIEELMRTSPPPSMKGRDVRLLYATQPAVEPPLFVFFTRYPELISDNYHRFLEKRLREQFGFDGVPIKLAFRKASRD
jgi:GTP-binding protein